VKEGGGGGGGGGVGWGGGETRSRVGMGQPKKKGHARHCVRGGKKNLVGWVFDMSELGAGGGPPWGGMGSQVLGKPRGRGEVVGGEAGFPFLGGWM